jgi:phage-related protein (TIGR01555 family)
MTSTKFTGESLEALAESLTSVFARMDGWSNVFSGLGIEGKDIGQSSTPKTRELPRGVLETEYEQSGIFARIIDAVPDNGTRRWIRLTVKKSDGTKDTDTARAIMDAMEELGARETFHEVWRVERLEGGSAALPMANDGKKPSEPIDLNRLVSVDGIEILSRWEINPQANMEYSTRAYEYPKAYEVLTGAENNIIDASRVWRFRGIRTTELRDTARMGWGLPVGQRVWDAVRQVETAFQYNEAVFKDLVQGVLTIKGLADMLAADDGNKTLVSRLRLMMLVASAFNAVLLDTDEQYERRTMSLTGLNDGFKPLMAHIAGASGIPLSIIFGQEPSGLSTDDQSGRRMFYDMVASEQRRKLLRPINGLIDLLVHAKKGPTRGVVPASWQVDFLPLEEPTDKQRAETDWLQAQADEKRIQDGVITPQEARRGLLSDPTCRYQLDDMADAEGQQVDQQEPLAALA